MTSKPLTKISEIPSEIRDICQFLVLFWYIVYVVLLTCSCCRLYSSKYFFPISFLYLHFSLPCLHRTYSIFSRIKFRQLLASFYDTFAHFSYSLIFQFSAFTLVCLRLCSAKEITSLARLLKIFKKGSYRILSSHLNNSLSFLSVFFFTLYFVPQRQLLKSLNINLKMQKCKLV